MKRHLFDPFSFVFGLLFLGLGLPLLLTESDLSFLDETWMFPAFLIFMGVVVLISARGSARTGDDTDEDTSQGL